jgi:hypothetical protein
VLISTSIVPVKELGNFVLAGISALVFALSAVSIILNVLKVQGKGYFRSNSIFQLIVGLFLLLGLFPPFGIIMIIFNVAVLVTLRERKAPDERMKHPPMPITRKYRALVGAGMLVIFMSTLTSWLNTMSFPLIGVYLHAVDLSLASNLVSNNMAMIFGFLALIVAPFSLISGLLGMFKRVFAWASGILAIIVGTGWIVSMMTIVEPGAYVFIFGGLLVLSAPIVAK